MSISTTSNWLLEARMSPTVLPPLDLPRRYMDATLKNVPHLALVKVARNYGTKFWEAAPKGLAPLLVGAAGEYKTVTAAAIARAVHDVMNIEVGWCNCAVDFIRFDREAFAPSTQVRIAQLKLIPFLVMDDFTQVPLGSRMHNTLQEIAGVRFDSLRPTLWTGNIVLEKGDTEKLAKTVGTFLARRILETSVGFRGQVKV